MPTANAQAPIVRSDTLKDGKANFLPLIKKVALANDVPEETIKYILQHESEYTVEIYGDHGLAYGPAQFHEEAFNRMKKNAMKGGKPFYYLKYKNPSDQVTLLGWALKNGYGPEWTTYRMYKHVLNT